MATISDLDQVLDQHMVLDLQCLDRQLGATAYATYRQRAEGNARVGG